MSRMHLTATIKPPPHLMGANQSLQRADVRVSIEDTPDAIQALIVQAIEAGGIRQQRMPRVGHPARAHAADVESSRDAGMKFTAVDRFHEESRCGRYTVTTAYTAEQPTHQAWRRESPISKLLGSFVAKDAARDACVFDAKTLTGES